MSDSPESDLSPTLGGGRAAAEPPPVAEPAPEAPASEPSDLPPELETLLNELGAPELAQLFGQFGALSQGLTTFVTETMQIVEERLPPTLAAFEGLIDAVEEALAPLLEDPAPDEPR